MANYNYTSKSEELQGNNKFNSWFLEIVSKLPKNLDEKAKELGAITRKRVIKDATSFLRMLLLYALTPTSTRLLAFLGGITNAGNMSDTAWRKRINKAAPWLSFVLGYLLDSMIDNAQGAHSIERRVILHDCSSIRQIGSSNTVSRMHMSYDITNSHISSVEVTDHHVAESLTHAKINEGDIVISDAGYGKSSQIKYVLSKKADMITRITPNSISIYNECYEKISIINHLKGKQIIEIFGFVCHENKYYPVRIIASPLPDDKIEAAINRKKRAASKKQNKIKPETLEYAKWVIIATTLDDSYTKESILDVYRSRWQIELLFKRMKQHLKAHSLNASSFKNALTVVYAWLIVWVLSEREAFMIEKYLIQNAKDPALISAWSINSVSFTATQAIILSNLSFYVNTDDLEMHDARHLLNHPSSRCNQYYFYKLCILPQFIA